MLKTDSLKHDDIAPAVENDLEPAYSKIVITDVLAEAQRLAPPLFTDMFEDKQNPLAIVHIRRAAIRYVEQGASGVKSFNAGAYAGTYATGSAESSIYTKQEVNALRELAGIGTRARSINTFPPGSVITL